jgi:hypothetical protein
LNVRQLRLDIQHQLADLFLSHFVVTRRDEQLLPV